MLNRSASLAMSTSVLKALRGKLDIKRHSPSFLYLCNAYMPAKHVSALTTADSRAKSWSVKSISVPLVYVVSCWGIVVWCGFCVLSILASSLVFEKEKTGCFP